MGRDDFVDVFIISLWIALATSLRTQDLYTGSFTPFSFILSKTAKKYQERICNILKDKQRTFA
jgi:hypothetical protein